jgi:hypothetical protein
MRPASRGFLCTFIGTWAPILEDIADAALGKDPPPKIVLGFKYKKWTAGAILGAMRRPVLEDASSFWVYTHILNNLPCLLGMHAIPTGVDCRHTRYWQGRPCASHTRQY